eukprot:TRINITY_DN38175_c0_g1_i2.p1 TRINITY_DN38175_c0_g1~~TRINITY_DN38175_c0_g1_i2.p1  ORF type:complete len:1144 (+),score=285.75 TRINITY_DN38175_c0_g1_i2:118-3549(+)
MIARFADCVTRRPLRPHWHAKQAWSWRQPRHAHVARVTVIPLEESGDVSATAELSEERQAKSLAQRASSDPQVQQRVQDALLRSCAVGQEHSKSSILETMRTLKWLHNQPGTPREDLEMYWDILSGFSQDQVRCLLSHELAEVVSILASCQRRCPELVTQLSQHCRRISRSMSAEDVCQILRAYAHMGWRSTSTVSRLGARMLELLRDPDTAPSVLPKHLRSLVAIYAVLKIPIHVAPNSGRKSDLELWKAVAVALPTRYEAMTASDFSVILNAFSKMGFSFSAIHRNVMHMFETAVPKLVQKILDESNSSPKTAFGPRELALICNAYAKIEAGPFCQPLLQAVAVKLVPQMADCTPQALSLVVNAYAKLSVPDADVFEAVAVEAAKGVVGYVPQDLANLSHAYAKVMVKHEAAFEKIADMSMRLMDKFKPMELGNLAWAVSRLQVKHEGLLTVLRDEVIYRGTVGKSLQEVRTNLYRFDLRSIQQCTQALSRLGVTDQRVFFVLFDMARQRVRDFAKAAEQDQDSNDAPKKRSAELVRAGKLAAFGQKAETLDGQGLAILLSAFARSKSDFATIGRWIPKQVLALQGQYNTQQMAMIFNACTKLGVAHYPLYQEMVKQAKPRVSQMSPKSIAVLVRAMAKVKVYQRTLMRAAVKVVSVRLQDLDVSDVGALMVGCAEMGYRDERFLRMLALLVKQRLSEFNPAELSIVFASYCQMRVEHAEWFDAILLEIFKRQHELQQKDATIVIYGMILLNAMAKHHAAAKNITSTLEERYPFNKHQGVFYSLLQVANKFRSNLPIEAVFQLQIVDLFSRLVQPTLYQDMRLELKTLLEKARAVNVAVDDYMQNSSFTHRRISKFFTRVGLHHRSEVFLGPFMLDIVIGDRVVVEVDGPSHFYRDTNSRTVTSIMKDLVLREMGFYVRHLPYQEWAQCGTNEKKLLYCATFWQDVLAASSKDSQKQLTPDSEDHRAQGKLPPLVDVLDMLAQEAERKLQQPEGQQDPKPVALPAFYADGGDAAIGEDDAGNDDGDGTKTKYSIDAEQAGTRSVQDMLEAHKEAEEQLIADRRLGISAGQRPSGEQQGSAAEEWEQEYLRDATSTAQGHGTHGSDEALRAALHEEALREQMRDVFPRSKRRAARHSGSTVV